MSFSDLANPSLIASLSVKLSTARRPAARAAPDVACWGSARCIILSGAVAYGAWRHYQLHTEVIATAEQTRDFVPTVLTAPVRASAPTMSVVWPGSTEAFALADIYARASGYITKRNVDIGSRVKQGDVLVEITAPEVQHQISQAEATLAQDSAALQQAQANLRLAQVTWDRDRPLVHEGWATQQQGTVDVETQNAQRQPSRSRKRTSKHNRRRFPFCAKQRSTRPWSRHSTATSRRAMSMSAALVQADASTGTDMFTLMNDDVLRIQLYVPQDEAFGVAPGVEAVIRVPEMPGREFPGTVTRIADALQPGTRTLLTEVDVPNPDHALPAGVYCTVELKIPRKTPSLIVQAGAIVFNSNGLNVWVVEDGVAHLRPVTVGARLRRDRRGQRGRKRRRPGDPQSAG